MSKSVAPIATPSAGGEHQSQDRAERVRRQRNLFFVMAVNMTWQMAVVVLVPIIGGYELDRLLGTLPGLTIVGFLLAMFGTFVIMKRTFDIQNDMPAVAKKEEKGGRK